MNIHIGGYQIKYITPDACKKLGYCKSFTGDKSLTETIDFNILDFPSIEPIMASFIFKYLMESDLTARFNFYNHLYTKTLLEIFDILGFDDNLILEYIREIEYMVAEGLVTGNDSYTYKLEKYQYYLYEKYLPQCKNSEVKKKYKNEIIPTLIKNKNYVTIATNYMREFMFSEKYNTDKTLLKAVNEARAKWKFGLSEEYIKYFFHHNLDKIYFDSLFYKDEKEPGYIYDENFTNRYDHCGHIIYKGVIYKSENESIGSEPLMGYESIIPSPKFYDILDSSNYISTIGRFLYINNYKIIKHVHDFYNCEQFVYYNIDKNKDIKYIEIPLKYKGYIDMSFYVKDPEYIRYITVKNLKLDIDNPDFILKERDIPQEVKNIVISGRSKFKIDKSTLESSRFELYNIVIRPEEVKYCRLPNLILAMETISKYKIKSKKINPEVKNILCHEHTGCKYYTEDGVKYKKTEDFIKYYP